MKIIGIDSSGLVASIALLEDEQLIAEYTINFKKTHSQTLLPMLDELVQLVDLDFSTIDAIAIAKGPGSFTGLRIGSATAKGLGFAWNVPIIEVSTLDALAYNLYDSARFLCPIMDARREQVYTGIYEITKENELKRILEPVAISIHELIEYLNKLGKEVVFLGDGVPVYKKQIEDNLEVSFVFAPCHHARQRAGSVAVLGAKEFIKGNYIKASEHSPDYLRLSQAERERKEAGLC